MNPHRSLHALAAVLLFAAQGATQECVSGRITGRVLDALGEGITAARVQMHATIDGADVMRRSVSDADGMFVFGEIPVHGDIQSVTLIAESKGRTRARCKCELRRTNPEAFPTLRLWDAGSIRVHAVDDEGHAVAGVAVLAVAHDPTLPGPESNATGDTDAQGTVELGGVPLGTVDVRTGKPGFLPTESTISLEDHADVEVRLKRGEGIALHVHVKGLPEGREATIWTTPYAGRRFTALPAFQDRATTVHGELSMQSLPDLSYVISAQVDGYVETPQEQRVEPGPASHEVTITLQPIGELRARGVLLDEAGAPIPGAKVCGYASRRTARAVATTGEDGRFALDPIFRTGEMVAFELPGGEVTLASEWGNTRPDGVIMNRHPYPLDLSKEYELVAIPAATIQGKIVDAHGGPVRGRKVELHLIHSAPSPVPIPMDWTTSMADGSFAFRGVYPYPEPVCVSLGFHARTATDNFTLARGQTVSGLVLEAAPFGAVAGKILDGRGKPVIGARLQLVECSLPTGVSNGSRTATLSDREGRFRFVDVDPGGQTIEVMGPDRKPVARSPVFKVDPGATCTQDLELPR